MLKATTAKDAKRLAGIKKKMQTDQRDFKLYLDRIEDRDVTRSDIEAIGEFHECYGVWFCGFLWENLKAATGDSYRTVFFDAKPEKITEGIHDIQIGQIQAKLYFWRAQGYPRGMVFLPEEEQIADVAAQLMEEKVWNWEKCLAH